MTKKLFAGSNSKKQDNFTTCFKTCGTISWAFAQVKQAMISLQGMAYDELFGEKLILFDFCRSVVIIFFYYVLSLYDFDCNLTSIYKSLNNIYFKVNEARLSSTVL